MRTPDELDPEEVDARWNDLTAQLGDIGGHREIRRPPVTGPRDYIAEEDDGAFVPPVPEDRPFNPRTVLGWFLIGVGLVGIFVIALARGSAVAGVFCALLSVAGVGVLVTGLPSRRDPDDDGAQV